ncbi:DUF1707 SHOCT-like domain-containing protein [Nocardioides daphniae]|uniref:DUF1707 and DUF2154 domain-containing protein n=1 Tax=Nocardioides daphniae TaxID=402297 RepID=A0A4P7U975_9ACTN|nr:DUF1707 domain-containing protein [Nocardioides daphniae]QCC76620.1 DUF1707 and DUF2154 domain-containing protein [Nocardioides daphniae]GGD14726.1 hypothetical protein GCM10007231_12140 [Nocardioides daphniae]
MDHQHGDPSRLRISDADRHKVADVLRDAAADGRIDLDELEERLEATYAAKVYADLVPITLDLPGPHLPAPQTFGGIPATAAPGGVPLPVHTSSFALMSSVDRKGVWRVPDQLTAFAVMGAVTLDLRQAVFTAQETVIYAHTLMGSVDIHVNAGTQVIVEGHGVMGAYEQGRDRVQPEIGLQSPTIRVKGLALMGAVTVTRKRMPGEPRNLRKKPGR